MKKLQRSKWQNGLNVAGKKIKVKKRQCNNQGRQTIIDIGSAHNILAMGRGANFLLNCIFMWQFLIRRKPSANSSSYFSSSFFLSSSSFFHNTTFLFCLFFASCIEFLVVYSILVLLNLVQLCSALLSDCPRPLH